MAPKGRPARSLKEHGTSEAPKAGFNEVSQRGSHLKLRNKAGRTVIVPMHRELARGTLRSILRQAGLAVEAFIELL
jgi:predicted RNA binding protein YcfA (HicA-like mRNA interferase family)